MGEEARLAHQQGGHTRVGKTSPKSAAAPRAHKVDQDESRPRQQRRPAEDRPLAHHIRGQQEKRRQDREQGRGDLLPDPAAQQKAREHQCRHRAALCPQPNLPHLLPHPLGSIIRHVSRLFQSRFFCAARRRCRDFPNSNYDLKFWLICRILRRSERKTIFFISNFQHQELGDRRWTSVNVFWPV